MSDWSSDVCSSDLLLTIYAALTDRDLSAAVGEFAGKGFADFKQVLTDVAVAHLGPMGEEMKRMVNDPGYVDSVLRDGAERAQAIAAPTLAKVYYIVGLDRKSVV